VPEVPHSSVLPPVSAVKLVLLLQPTFWCGTLMSHPANKIPRAGMRVPCPRNGGHHCSVAARRSAVSSGTRDDKVEVAGNGHVGERATAVSRPDLRVGRPRAPRGPRHMLHTTFARLASKPVCELCCRAGAAVQTSRQRNLPCLWWDGGCLVERHSGEPGSGMRPCLWELRRPFAHTGGTSRQRPAESHQQQVEGSVEEANEREQFRRHLEEFAEKGRLRHAVAAAAAV